jgi:pyruvate dehydrogenase E2 component (dihydrolipoamide acetyltransferase)
MATPVVMPQMGESIAEGTVVRWLKKVGDTIERDEPLFEISTDKVDAEIPSPMAGVLTEIKVQPGETVAVNSVVATIGQAGEPPSASASQAAGPPAEPQPQGDGHPAKAPMPAAKEAPPSPSAAAHRGTNGGTREVTREELRRQRSSPLVRRIAREHNIDITELSGSGIAGRVTKSDILDYIESKPTAPGPPAASGVHDARVEIQPLSVMRKKIAEHMVLSRRTSAHVHSVFHVNFSTVDRIRQAKKAEYERMGAKLTYMSFIAKAVIDAIRRHPIINSSLDGDNVVYKKDVNLGIAVALDNGLIVPVVRNADEKNILGLSRAIADVAGRARSKQLKPEEVQGGTFTITNPGTFGAQFGMPIINQPQVAILGVGIVEKRPIVVDDAIAIRTMAYLTLGYDHRLIDGAVADQFMSDVKQTLENFDSNQV